jgi:hypothetical protein
MDELRLKQIAKSNSIENTYSDPFPSSRALKIKFWLHSQFFAK